VYLTSKCSRTRRAYKDPRNKKVEELNDVKKIGDVVTRLNRMMVCRTHKNAKKFLGKRVYSRDGIPVGTIVDIFGPVDQPYLRIIQKTNEQVDTLFVK
jgi:rRNA processing protein Gar1